MTLWMSAAAGATMMCALRTTSGRNLMASRTAPALRSRFDAFGIDDCGVRTTSRSEARSRDSAPGWSSATTRTSNRSKLSTRRLTSSCMPPKAGGKSGVRTSRRRPGPSVTAALR